MQLLYGRRITLLLMGVFLAVASMAWAAESGQDAADLPTVKLVYERDIDSLPLYVGVEEGFFP